MTAKRGPEPNCWHCGTADKQRRPWYWRRVRAAVKRSLRRGDET